MCPSPMASMNPRQVEVQLLWVLDLVVIGVHVEVHLQPRQETSCLFPRSDMTIVLGLGSQNETKPCPELEAAVE